MNWKVTVIGALVTIAAVGGVTAYAASNGTGSSTNGTSQSPTVKPPLHAGHRAHFGRIGPVELAGVLGVDPATLRADLKNGESPLQIAQGKGMSEQTLISDLQSHLKAHLDKAVQNGKLSADQEQKILTNFASHATELVEHKGLPPLGKRRPMGFFGHAAMDDVAKALNTEPSSLRAALRSGKSIADVAQSQNVPLQTVINTLMNDAKADLDKAVQAGKLSATQEQAMEAKLQARITAFVQHKGNLHRAGGSHDDSPSNESGQSPSASQNSSATGTSA